MSWRTIDSDSGPGGRSGSGSSSSGGSSGSGSGSSVCGSSSSSSSDPGLRNSGGQLLHQPFVLNPRNTYSVRIVFRLPSQLSDQRDISRGLFPQLFDRGN